MIFHISHKDGDYSGDRNDRFFVDMTEENVNEIFREFLGLVKIEEELTTDVRPWRGEERWLNEYYKKSYTV